MCQRRQNSWKVRAAIWGAEVLRQREAEQVGRRDRDVGVRREVGGRSASAYAYHRRPAPRPTSTNPGFANTLSTIQWPSTSAKRDLLEQADHAMRRTARRVLRCHLERNGNWSSCGRKILRAHDRAGDQLREERARTSRTFTTELRRRGARGGRRRSCSSSTGT